MSIGGFVGLRNPANVRTFLTIQRKNAWARAGFVYLALPTGSATADGFNCIDDCQSLTVI
jgi:hypothetical protein